MDTNAEDGQQSYKAYIVWWNKYLSKKRALSFIQNLPETSNKCKSLEFESPSTVIKIWVQAHLIQAQPYARSVVECPC